MKRDGTEHGHEAEGEAIGVATTATGASRPPRETPGSGRDLEEEVMRARLQSSLFGAKPEPIRVGRFVVLGRVGAGAMGVVHAAYDETLDRKVAIKLISPDRAADDHARQRLIREARAMAKLSHPNVVQIYEAGEHESQVFIAMEFVEGKTLRSWMAEDREPVGLRAVIDTFVGIAAGLHAAHEAGIVHRDFKPDNVLINASMQPKVADFGLAVSGDLAEAEDGSAPSADARLTRTGHLVGTPLYMSPEQHAGKPADARSDQFSYCLALWEAIFGEHPLERESVAEIRRALTRDTLRPPSTGAPRWLRSALARGLGTDPERRWPTMADLASALVRGSQSRQRNIVTATSVLGVGTVVGAIWASAGADDHCVGVEAHLADVWTASRRATLRGVLEQVDVDFARSAAQKIDTLLASYAEDWIAAYRAACEATHLHHEQSEDLMFKRVRCLEGRKRDFNALVTVIEAPDTATLIWAVEAATQLPLIAFCADATFVSAEMPLPDDPEKAAAVESIRRELARVDALFAAGKYDDAHRKAETVVRRARKLEYPPILVAALNRKLLPACCGSEREYDAALAAAREAYGLSHLASQLDRAQNHEVLGQALSKKHSYEESLLEHRKALSMRIKLHGPEHPDVGRSHLRVGWQLFYMGKLDQALAEHEKALGISTKTLGPGHPQTGYSRAALGWTLLRLHENEAAVAEFRSGIGIHEHAVGAWHPELGMMHRGLGLALQNLNRFDDAATELRDARSIWARAHGETHATVATMHSDMADLEVARGRLDRAEVELRSVLRIRVADDPALASVHIQLGQVLAAGGKYADALVEYRKALSISTGLHGTDHRDVGRAHSYIGQALTALEKHEEAVAAHEKALALRLKILGPEHEHVTGPVMGLAVSLVCLGRIAGAREALETAERAAAANPRDEIGAAQTSFARVVVESHGRKPTPSEIAAARRARDVLSRRARFLVGIVDVWLRQHRLPASQD